MHIICYTIGMSKPGGVHADGKAIALASGLLILAMSARVGLLADGKMGASQERAQRIRTALEWAGGRP